MGSRVRAVEFVNSVRAFKFHDRECNNLHHTYVNTYHTYNTLQHTAIHCNTLHHTATHCTTLHHTAPHCNTLQHTATTAQSVGAKRNTKILGRGHGRNIGAKIGGEGGGGGRRSNLRINALFSSSCVALRRECIRSHATCWGRYCRHSEKTVR